MKTIGQAVEAVLAESPFLLEALSEGIANNAEIARRIRPEVEKKLYETVTNASIAMAIHRLSKQHAERTDGKRHLRNISDLTVRSNLVEFILENSADSSHLIELITREARGHKSAFVNFSRGTHESILIVSADLEEISQKTLKKLSGLRIARGLSAITMRLPEESLAAPGVYYHILKALAHDDVSLVEIMSVLREFSIIIEDKDVDRAFSVLKMILK